MVPWELTHSSSLEFERPTVRRSLTIQGSVLGPRMFIMYTADLVELADEQRVNLHSYADDSQIYVHCSPS